jgi:hypothetical protein
MELRFFPFFSSLLILTVSPSEKAKIFETDLSRIVALSLLAMFFPLVSG